MHDRSRSLQQVPHVEDASIDIPGGVKAPAEARDAVDELTLGYSDETRETLRLLVSELVTNSVRHAGAAGPEHRIGLHVRTSNSRVRVEVLDEGPGFEPPNGPAADAATSGWGLRLVGQIADRWGVERDRSTLVWFEMKAAPG
jgi:anti-sigma regulatory factor (Ser/Thr protein kinase)